MRRGPLVLGLAVAGAAVAALAVWRSGGGSPPSGSPPELPLPPFASYVVGTGSIEAGTGDVVVGTPVAGVLTRVLVTVGDRVQAGDPLFEIDDRDLQAQLKVASARVAEAEAAMKHPRHELAFNEELAHADDSTVSERTLTDLQDQVAVAEATLGLARSEEERLRAEIALHTVRSPVSGRVLQLRARVGEFVQDGQVGTPPLVVGDDANLHVRVDIDENEAWRVRPEGAAVAFVRGNPDIRIPLRFDHVVPYLSPKTLLTGSSTERTDLRVLQVVYGFERAALPVYVGQRVDVYVETPAPAEPARKEGY